MRIQHMFTGIIEHEGTIRAREERDGSVRLTIDLGPLREGLRVGDSVAVSGVCLTAIALEGDGARFDVIPESIARTWFGDRARAGPGARVNLERALRMGGRLDGHLVQGHVDGTARVAARSDAGVDGSGSDVRLGFECASPLTDDMVEKGSVAIDGVSLTLAGVGRGRFEVALIPHTLAVTTLRDLRSGDLVNVETDVVGKWIRRLVAPYLPSTRSP